MYMTGYYFDPSLVQRESSIKQQLQESIDRQIEDIKKKGLRKPKVGINQDNSEQKNNQSRGFRI